MTCNDGFPFEANKAYFVRLVTYHVIGEVERVVGDFVLFKEGTMAWVADSGRFTQAINDGNLSEVEPVSVVGGFNLAAVVDFYEWRHPLPRTQK